jgi:type IV pilus assembly protein PilB
MSEPTFSAGAGPSSLRQHLQGELGIRDIRDVRLLERLVHDRALAPSQLAAFKRAAEQSGRTIAEHAVESGIADAHYVLQVVAELYQLGAVAIDRQEVEGVAQLVRAEDARRLRILPYGRSETGELLVAISDGQRVEAVRRELSALLPRERAIVFRLAAPSALELQIERTYSLQPEIDLRAAGPAGVPVQISARAPSENEPVVRLFKQILAQAAREGASDLHIEAQPNGSATVRARIDGSLYKLLEIPAGTTQPFVAFIKTSAGMEAFDRRNPQDGRFSMRLEDRKIDIRVVTIPVATGGEDGAEQAVMRLLDPNRALMTLEELGMTKANFDRFCAAIANPYGLALTCGPTGSGKTTTNYAALQVANTPDRKVMSVEDPVELHIPGIQQIEVPRVGEDRWGFADVLPKIVRSDPDVIMVGEIRDHKTALLSIEAALTGHFVYSTLHTNDAAGAIVRLTDSFGVDPVLLAETLEIVIAQRLVRRVCACAATVRATPDYLRQVRAPAEALAACERGQEIVVKRANPEGCVRCAGRGYKGRIGVHEVLTMSESLREAIIARRELSALKQLAREAGMLTLREDAWAKVVAGVTTMEDVNRWV